MSWGPGALCLLTACRLGFEPLASDSITADVTAVTCPVSYTVSLPSTTSRYLAISSDLPPTDHHARCAQDLPGATHLVVLDSIGEETELAAVLATVPPPALARFYVGAVQRANQPAVDAGWLTYTGEPVLPALWTNGEPDDLDDVENALESYAVIENGMLVDVSGNTGYGAVCECDGRMIAPEVSDLLMTL